MSKYIMIMHSHSTNAEIKVDHENYEKKLLIFVRRESQYNGDLLMF